MRRRPLRHSINSRISRILLKCVSSHGARCPSGNAARLEMTIPMSTAPDWLHSLPALERLDAEALDLLSKAATRVELKAGTVLFRPGDACASFLIVLAGSVRVQL